MPENREPPVPSVQKSPQQVLPLYPEQEAAKTAVVGMTLVMVALTMMFGGMFYGIGMLRIRSPFWPPPGMPTMPILLPAMSTVVLLASSAVLKFAKNSLAAGSLQKHKQQVLLSAALGAVFVVLQTGLVVKMWGAGLRLDSGPYGSLFFFLTAFHAFHVLVGIGLFGWLTPNAVGLARTEPRTALHRTRLATQTLRTRLVSMYWHFVDIVWVLLFVVLFLY